MRLSEIAGHVQDGDPVLMINGPDGMPVPVSTADVGVMRVPGVGVVPYLLLEAASEEED